MADTRRRGGKPPSAPAPCREGAIWGLQAEKHFYMPLDSVQPMSGEATQREITLNVQRAPYVTDTLMACDL